MTRIVHAPRAGRASSAARRTSSDGRVVRVRATVNAAGASLQSRPRAPDLHPRRAPLASRAESDRARPRGGRPRRRSSRPPCLNAHLCGAERVLPATAAARTLRGRQTTCSRRPGGMSCEEETFDEGNSLQQEARCESSCASAHASRSSLALTLQASPDNTRSASIRDLPVGLAQVEHEHLAAAAVFDSTSRRGPSKIGATRGGSPAGTSGRPRHGRHPREAPAVRLSGGSRRGDSRRRRPRSDEGRRSR